MPALSTVFRWLAGDREFQEQYTRAMDARATLLAEEILEMPDDSSGDVVTDPETGAVRMDAEFVARSRLRVDSRKWLAARMAPKKYGDKVTQRTFKCMRTTGPDPRRALGPAAHLPHQQAGHVTAPDQCCKTSESSCQGAVHTSGGRPWGMVGLWLRRSVNSR